MVFRNFSFRAYFFFYQVCFRFRLAKSNAYHANCHYQLKHNSIVPAQSFPQCFLSVSAFQQKQQQIIGIENSSFVLLKFMLIQHNFKNPILTRLSSSFSSLSSSSQKSALVTSLMLVHLKWLVEKKKEGEDSIHHFEDF